MSGSLAWNHTIYCEYGGRLADPALSPINSYVESYVILDDKGQDVTHLYDVTTATGTVNVYERELEVIPKNTIVKFDGRSYTASEYTLGGYHGLSAGHTTVVNMNGSRSTPGITAITIESIHIYDEYGNDVTYGYDLKLQSGRIHIYVEKLEFSTGSAEKIYDGTPLTCDEWSLLRGTLLGGHYMNVTMEDQITNVSTLKNAPTIHIFDASGTDVTDWYLCDTSAAGQLKINAKTLEIRSGDATTTLDRAPLVCDEYEIIDGGVAYGDTLEITIVGRQTTVGYSENLISKVQIFDEEGKDVTSNYIIVTHCGILTVTPAL